jgi:AcrR family transcriptional regulator
VQRWVGGDADLVAMREESLVAAEVAEAPDGLYDKLSPGPGLLKSEVADHQSARIHRAMIEITAEQGYDAVKVRDVVQLAGVSTRAFYSLFTGKEDCFLRTHELLVRRAARGIIISQAGEHGWQERLDLVFSALANILADEPDAVCLATVDAYAAGPAALEQARRARSTIEAMIGETFTRAPRGVAVPPLVIEGMVAGVAQVVRGRFLSGGKQELPDLASKLGEWVSCYPGQDIARIPECDARPLSKKPGSEMGPSTPSRSVDDDRGIILAATAKLAAAEGYGDLTIPRIRAGAGVSRRIFNNHFKTVEDCFLVVLEQRADEAIEQAGRAQIGGRTWSGGIYRAIAILCDRVAGDPILANACLADDFPPGSSGSRCRKRLIAAVTAQLVESIPADQRPSDLLTEATLGAIWELFHHHVVRSSPAQRPQIAATLSYMALAPIIGPSAAFVAIREEQGAQ